MAFAMRKGRYADALLALKLQPRALDVFTRKRPAPWIEVFEGGFPPREKGYAPTQDRFLALQQQVHDGHA